jgi:hypothetical protein
MHAPGRANARAAARPTPPLAPVMTMISLEDETVGMSNFDSNPGGPE